MTKKADAIVERLMAGEAVFLPGMTWRDVQAYGSQRIYVAAIEAGKFAHFVRDVQEGQPGLRVFVDDERGTTGPASSTGGLDELFGKGRPSRP